ncbi:hypothetical protein L0F63_000372 [Massospora cicadina]|nr:hypothetical protein L0F63_000372 [Massospora cicadina]
MSASNLPLSPRIKVSNFVPLQSRTSIKRRSLSHSVSVLKVAARSFTAARITTSHLPVPVVRQTV